MAVASELDDLRSAVSTALAAVDELQQKYELRRERYDNEDLPCPRWLDESPRPDGTATGKLIYSQAHAALEVAREMQSFSRASNEHLGVHPIASWLTLRPVLEASLRAYWVLAPVDYRIDDTSAWGKEGDGRIERAARWARDGLREGRKIAQQLGDSEVAAHYERDIESLEQEISERGLPKIKNMAATLDIAKGLPDPAVAKAAEAYWRLLSGLDHGDEAAQRIAWVSEGGPRVRVDEQIFLGAWLNVTMIRTLALERFLELME